MTDSRTTHDSHGGHSATIEQTSLDSDQHGQAQNIVDEEAATYGNTTDADLGANMEAQNEAVKDRIDDVLTKGPKKAGPGGSVQVGETGDLHDLAARRQL